MLFLLPINEKLSWHRLPVVTLVLVGLMIGTFLFFQLDDKSAREQAKQFYFESGLSQIEIPLYIRFARRHMHINAYYNLIEGVRNEVLSQDDLYWAGHTDPIFQSELANGNVVLENHPDYGKWRQLRREYNYLLEKDQVYHNGFKTAQPTLLEAFASFFLHGGWQHLLANILFLLFIGINLEVFVGSIIFFGSVLLIHALTICVYSFFYPFSMIPLVGASGAIAGLIGIHALVFSTRRINFFVNILFYFNTIKLPGLVVIPLWLGWELLDYMLHPISVKSYASHISGFIAGLFIGVMIYRSKKQYLNKTASSSEASYENFQGRFDDALNKMSDLNFPAAKKILLELNKESPNNHQVLFHLFNATKVDPSSEDYHQTASKIFHIKDNSKACVSMINIVFKNYVKRAEPSIRFDPTVFLSLNRKFRKYGYLDDVEKILHVLVQYNRSGKLDELLAGEILQLARCYQRKCDSVKASRIIDWCEELYPETASFKESKHAAM